MESHKKSQYVFKIAPYAAEIPYPIIPTIIHSIFCSMLKIDIGGIRFSVDKEKYSKQNEKSDKSFIISMRGPSLHIG